MSFTEILFSVWSPKLDFSVPLHAEMSCLMEALQDKRVRLQPECKKRLQDRIDMWSYAAKVNIKSWITVTIGTRASTLMPTHS